MTHYPLCLCTGFGLTCSTPSQIKEIRPSGSRFKVHLHYHGWSVSEDQWVFDTDLDRRDWLQRAAKNGNADVSHARIYTRADNRLVSRRWSSTSSMRATAQMTF